MRRENNSWALGWLRVRCPTQKKVGIGEKLRLMRNTGLALQIVLLLSTTIAYHRALGGPGGMEVPVQTRVTELDADDVELLAESLQWVSLSVDPLIRLMLKRGSGDAARWRMMVLASALEKLSHSRNESSDSSFWKLFQSSQGRWASLLRGVPKHSRTLVQGLIELGGAACPPGVLGFRESALSRYLLQPSEATRSVQETAPLSFGSVASDRKAKESVFVWFASLIQVLPDSMRASMHFSPSLAQGLVEAKQSEELLSKLVRFFQKHYWQAIELRDAGTPSIPRRHDRLLPEELAIALDAAVKLVWGAPHPSIPTRGLHVGGIPAHYFFGDFPAFFRAIQESEVESWKESAFDPLAALVSPSFLYEVSGRPSCVLGLQH
jgi:hypothetical protein